MLFERCVVSEWLLRIARLEGRVEALLTEREPRHDTAEVIVLPKRKALTSVLASVKA